MICLVTQVQPCHFADNVFDNDEYLKIELYVGTNWNTVFNCTHNACDDNNWHQETLNLDSYLGVRNFNLRFISNESGGHEETDIDDAEIVGLS